MSDKKKTQLGMNPSTASHRLVKDLLWNFICESGQNKCHCCGEEMSRDDFSIEHKTPWLDSEDPVGLYFDIGNISYSHLRCNIASARKIRLTEEELLERKEKKNEYNKSVYTKEKRRERYLRNGK